MSNKPIGLLDSGVGGLTVLKAAQERLPEESFVYIGDARRCPYGDRTSQEIIEYTVQLAVFLVKQDVKLIVIACNTATAHALEKVKETVSVPVIGVIKPGSEAAVTVSKTKEVGVLATVSTVESDFYAQSIHKLDDDFNVKSLPCPDFVPLVENNRYETTEAKEIVDRRLRGFKTEDMDTVILGCTHFPLLAPFIQEALGQGILLVDSGALTSSEIENVLHDEQLEADSGKKPAGTVLYTTGSADTFKTIASNWLNIKNIEIRQISTERLTQLNDR